MPEPEPIKQIDTPKEEKHSIINRNAALRIGATIAAVAGIAIVLSEAGCSLMPPKSAKEKEPFDKNALPLWQVDSLKAGTSVNFASKRTIQPFKSDIVSSSENETRLGADRIAQIPGSKDVYWKDGDTYRSFGAFGLMTPSGDPQKEETWSKFKEDYWMNGAELLWCWQNNGGSIAVTQEPGKPDRLTPKSELQPVPALEYAKKYNIPIMPDIRFACFDIILRPGEIPERKYKYNPDKAAYLLENYPNIIGFTVDEPGSSMKHEIEDPKAPILVDWEEVISDYANSCVLPLHVTSFGKWNIPEENHRNVCARIDQIQRQHGIKVTMGGQFNYDYNNPTTADNTPESVWQWIAAGLRTNWLDAQNGLVAARSYTVLPAHDFKPAQANEYYSDEFGNYCENIKFFPWVAEQSMTLLPPATRGYLHQATTALALDPSTTRILWWNWPADGQNEPYKRSGESVKAARRILGELEPYILGNPIQHVDSPGQYAYSIKQAKVIDPRDQTEKLRDAIFIVSEDGTLPDIENASPLMKYRDIYSGLVIEADASGKIIPPVHNLGEEYKYAVFAFAPMS